MFIIIALETFSSSSADAVERLNGNWTITNFNSITAALLLAEYWDKQISVLKLSIDAVVVAINASLDASSWSDRRRVESWMLNFSIPQTDSATIFVYFWEDEETD